MDQFWQCSRKSVTQKNEFLLDNPLMSDIIFEFEETTEIIHAHKLILGKSSPVFYSMFYGQLQERGERVLMADTSRESFLEVLRYLYTDWCLITTENSIEILYLSKKYLIPFLEDEAMIFLRRNVSEETVWPILQVSVLCSSSILEELCIDLIGRGTQKVMKYSNFLEISKATLEIFLRIRTVNCCEYEIFNACMNWTKHQCKNNGVEFNYKQRVQYLGDLIKLFKFSTMSVDQLQECLKLVSKREMKKIMAQETRSRLVTKCQLPMKEVCVPTLIYTDIEKPFSVTTTESILTVSVSKSIMLFGVRTEHLRCTQSQTLYLLDENNQQICKMKSNFNRIVFYQPVLLQADKQYTFRIILDTGRWYWYSQVKDDCFGLQTTKFKIINSSFNQINDIFYENCIE